MTKHVLVAIPCLMQGGTEYQTLNLVKALKEIGCHVTVLCYFEYDNRMVKYMEDAGSEVMLMSPDGIRPQKLPAMVQTLFTGFKKALKSVKPDAVHVQYMAPGSLAILLFKLLGVRHVLATAHVPGHIYRRKWVPKLIAAYLTDVFLCVSKSSEHAFFSSEPQIFDPKSFRQGRKHFTIYNCVEIPETLENKSFSNRNSLTIGVVSRLSREKGIDVLIDAMPQILSAIADIRLMIVGDGEERERLQDQVSRLKIDHAVTWMGLRPKEDLPDLYRQMDVVVIPSRFEGFGLTAIEAMRFGCPVIASNVDGLREIVVHVETGLLYESENTEALTVAAIELLNNPDLRMQMSNNGYERVQKNFSCKIFRQNITELYESVLIG